MKFCVSLAHSTKRYIYEPPAVSHLPRHRRFGMAVTIAEPTLPRSLPLVVYTPQGGTKKSALKGCLCPAFKGAYLNLEHIRWLLGLGSFFKKKDKR